MSESCAKQPAPNSTDSKENGGPVDWFRRGNVLIHRHDSDKEICPLSGSCVEKRTPILRTPKRTAAREIGFRGKMF